MNKQVNETIQLKKGEVSRYDFGSIKLHAYRTNDLIDDEVFVVEKDGKAVVIESPCFFDNNRELTDYFSRCGVQIEGILLAYHMAGGSFLPDVKKYSTVRADEYGKNGGGRALIDKFTGAFGTAFDASIHTVTDYLRPGSVQIGGIAFSVVETQEAFDLVIPEINAVYTHMLGHDCHSIVAGAAHADAVIAQLEDYLRQGYAMILTSHYTPEDLKDVETKIAYLKNLKELAAACTDAEEFKGKVKETYPAYSGENYLEMTAGFFFA